MFSNCLLIFIVFYILCRVSVLHEVYSKFKKCTEGAVCMRWTIFFCGVWINKIRAPVIRLSVFFVAPPYFRFIVIFLHCLFERTKYITTTTITNDFLTYYSCLCHTSMVPNMTFLKLQSKNVQARYCLTRI